MYGYGGAYAAGDAGRVSVDGIFGEETEASFCVFQKNTGQAQDGICGKNGWKAAVEAYEGEYLLQNRIKITIYLVRSV